MVYCQSMKHGGSRIPIIAVFTAILAAGCTSIPARLAVRDAAAAGKVKKIAVMPFFVANTLSVDVDAPPSGIFNVKPANYARIFAGEAQKALGSRYTFIYGEQVENQLKQYGHYAGYLKDAGSGQRTGFTVAEAVKAGKALGADAVMLGSYAYGENEQIRAYFNEAISIRVLDVESGRVLWGAAARQSDFGGTVIQKVLDKLKKEGP